MNIKFIVMATLLFFIVPRAEAQSCTGCTNTLSGGGNSAINVTAGQTVCLTSGTFAPSSLNIASGGTLCVGPGVILTINWSNTINGTIINHGNISFDGTNGINGTIENYKLLKFSGWWVINTTGVIENRDSFLATSQGNYLGTLENTGYTFFSSGISNYSGTFNNYGYLKITSSLNVGNAAYLTNDSTIFIDVSSGVQFNGPMLTNNGRMTINGNFKINQRQTQGANNGIIVTSGDFSLNPDGNGSGSAKIVNNCRIVAGNNLIINNYSLLENNGLLWALHNVTVAGDTTAAAGLKNSSTGFVRGVDFTNSGKVTGLGKFYFTGTTTFQSNGKFAGDSASEPIEFYDASPNGTQIFDAISPTNPAINTVRPSSMTLLDTTDYINCNSFIPPTVAGNPPHVKGDTVTLCAAAPVTFHLIMDSLIAPYDNTYSIVWSALKLFSVGGAENTTNLITPQGTFVADTINQTIVFTPAVSFTSGTATAQFKVADKKAGDPITYTSPKATITINVTPVEAPTNLEATGF